jgi:hypothetical protein
MTARRMKCCFILMKRAWSLTGSRESVKLAKPCRKLAKIPRVDMTSVSYPRNDEMPPTGQPPTEADGQS